jgi:Right handed beta helix region
MQRIGAKKLLGAVLMLSQVGLVYVYGVRLTLADSPGVTFYVDGQSGNDGNAGDSARPFRTIGKATDRAVANSRHQLPTTIIVKPGTYRESLSISASPEQGQAAITIEAANPGTVIVSGADVWSDWTADASVPGQYVHAWPFQWGPCATPSNWPANLAPIVRRREMVFVNNKVMNQVLSPAELTESSFFVDDAAGQIVLRPPGGVAPAPLTTDVAVRAKLFESHGYNNLTLNGLTFTAAASCLPTAAVSIYGGTSDHLENLTASSNSWAGLLLNNISDASVVHLTTDNNGGSGLLGYKVKNSRFRDVEASENNLRGIKGGFHDFELAGAKFLRSHDTEFVNFRASRNQTFGLWFDTDNANIAVKNSTFSHNLFYGVFLEANQGPIAIETSGFCENGAEGIRVQNSDHVSIIENTFRDNGVAQVFVDGRMSARKGADWETSQPFTAEGHELTMTRNTFVASDPTVVLFGTSQSSPDNSRGFFASLSSDGNVFYHSATKQTLQYDAGGINHKARNLDLDSWRKIIHQDEHSSVAQPTSDVASACENP